MRYQDYVISASCPDWHYYNVNDDGTLGEFIDNGGVDTDTIEYEIYEYDPDEDDNQGDLVDGGYETIKEAQDAIDKGY